MPQGAENSKLGRRQGASVASTLQDSPLCFSPEAPSLVNICEWLPSHLCEQAEPGLRDQTMKGDGGNYCFYQLQGAQRVHRSDRHGDVTHLVLLISHNCSVWSFTVNNSNQIKHE